MAMTANRVYAMSAITALTAQNTTGVTDIMSFSKLYLSYVEYIGTFTFILSNFKSSVTSNCVTPQVFIVYTTTSADFKT